MGYSAADESFTHQLPHGFHGRRDRAFGVRASDTFDFRLWPDGFEDRAIKAWIVESADGTVRTGRPWT